MPKERKKKLSDKDVEKNLSEKVEKVSLSGVGGDNDSALLPVLQSDVSGSGTGEVSLQVQSGELDEDVDVEKSVAVKDNRANDYLLVSISSGYEFRTLMHLLQIICTSATFCFTAKGFKYLYVSPDSQYCVECDFPVNVLNNYKFSQENESITIGLKMTNLWFHVKSTHVNEMIRFFMLNSSDKSKKLHIQKCVEEGADINKASYIQLQYTTVPKMEIPAFDRRPDRIIAFSEFQKIGEMFKPVSSPYILVTKKVYDNETTIGFDVTIENQSTGAKCLYQNPSVFASDEEPLEESSVRIPKAIFDKFATSGKAAGIVRIYLEHEKFVLFEISFVYLTFVKLLIKDINAA